MMPVQTTLPSFQSRLHEIAAAEQGDGWLCACHDAGRFLLPSRELIAALAELLGHLGGGPVLEVCAGRGELAEALAAAGVPLAAADADPPAAASAVARASAAEALRRCRPALVLGCFVPVDAGVDEAVMACPWVQHYVVLGARVGGCLGSAALWRSASWRAEPLEQVSRWMLTRHDVWIPGPAEAILQHGEAWHLRRLAQPIHPARRSSLLVPQPGGLPSPGRPVRFTRAAPV